LAYRRGALDEARQYLTASIEAALEPDPAIIGLLGVIECQQGQSEWARQQLRAALRAALDRPNKRQKISVLWGPGEWLAAQGQLARAAELLAFVAHHPGTYRYTRDLAAETLAELEAEMPAATFATAVERGQALDLDATLQRLLADEFA
jgi:hypothetical protein